MNIQQVKASAEDIGDGGEDITAESLSKYEAAAADLGVALKEVKNGVAVLRDPMEVLNDLAEAFNKEADDSIKKANLINAIGGKYRGNQLSALLANWETYKNILEDFNSDNAVGSALRETQKDVESWSGQINVLKDRWLDLVNSIVSSKTATNTIKAFSSAINLLVGAADKFGGFTTLTTALAGIAGLRGVGKLNMPNYVPLQNTYIMIHA